MSTSISKIKCHVCDRSSLEIVEGFDTLCRVTSDCKPWPGGGDLSVCRACGCVQKVIDEVWRSEVESIYQNYSIYYQSNGVEQAVFDSGSGQGALRSRRLLEALAAHIELPDDGRLLDLGCGNGAMLRAFSSFAPRWTLAGAELSDRNRETIESIERVEALYVGAPAQIPGRFDILTMIHMLEHIPSPVEYLASLQERLKPGGLLVIEVPNYLQNPFDLLVADHSSHFTPRVAAEIVRKAGYQLVAVATDWVPKELTIVARRAVALSDEVEMGAETDPLVATTRAVQWLKETVNSARQHETTGNFGIFGTSINATWLFAELGDAVSFFVDEDPSRIGKTFMGRPVFHPLDAPPESHVFIALPRSLAESVQSRVARDGVSFILPPILEV